GLGYVVLKGLYTGLDVEIPATLSTSVELVHYQLYLIIKSCCGAVTNLAAEQMGASTIVNIIFLLLLQLMHNFFERRTCKTKVINGSMSDARVKAVTVQQQQQVIILMHLGWIYSVPSDFCSPVQDRLPSYFSSKEGKSCALASVAFKFTLSTNIIVKNVVRAVLLWLNCEFLDLE
ncbi:hypothetical protein ACJX0J_036765, partial [Zea mays]